MPMKIAQNEVCSENCTDGVDNDSMAIDAPMKTAMANAQKTAPMDATMMAMAPLTAPMKTVMASAQKTAPTDATMMATEW